jgi:hypothetical protein
MKRRSRLAVLLCFAALSSNACRHPPVGVLTLAPAGMHTTGTCSAQPDGTLTMSPGASADSTIYVEAGAVTIAVTAAPSSLENHPQIEMWLADEKIGAATLESTEAQAVPFHMQARASGLTGVRLVYLAETSQGDEPAPALHLEKVVITEP